MKSLGLDCLTLIDAAPVELIEVAATAGYATVSLWVQPPVLPGGTLAVPAMADDIRAALARTGVALGNLEVFNLNTDAPIDAFEEVIAFGAGLDARSATAIDFGPPRADIAERLAAFSRLVRRHGLEPLVEPIAMGNVRTVGDGAALIEAAGEEARIVLDFLHFVRTGSTIDDLRRVDPRFIGYVQICDGPAVIDPAAAGSEATEERLYPGEGQFPLAELLRAVPADIPWAVEAPSRSRRERGLSALDRAREARAATLPLLAVIGGA